MAKIRKVLIANRGEIACRVIKACKELGMKTVAVYSSVDKRLPHVLMADECYLIGPPPPLESYLDMQKLVDLAKGVGAEAIHPGYGFLAENHEFAKLCEDSGIIFVGPNSKSLRLVGDKLESRNTVAEAGVSIIPGMQSGVKDMEVVKEEAKKIGYPVIVKASMGGGGKGMRVVWNEEELLQKIETGMRESKSAFGDETVYLEKYLEEPRHVEFQILADNYGNVVHLFERECSIQRRHQKIVEETPSIALDENLRKRMGEAACKIAKAVGYTNAGTVEFLLDRNKNFYFLEVNARIQVEHPITEFVVGVDLVKQQLLLAQGERLNLGKLFQRGHAIECRIYAEDPENNFAPCPGKILFVKEPQGPGVRVDSGIYSGIEVPPYYDPILSKLVVYAEDRQSAINKMANSLSEYVILGIKTTIEFLKNIITHPEFIKGNTHTNFIEKNFPDMSYKKYQEHALICAALHTYMNKKVAKEQPVLKQMIKDPWQTIGRWEISSGV